MDLETASVAGGDTASLRDKIVKNFSPDDIEKLREKLYEASTNGNHQANVFLRALPTRGSSLARPSGAGGAGPGSRDSDAPLPALTRPVPKTYSDAARGAAGSVADAARGAGSAIEGGLQRAFPKQEKSVDPWQTDPLMAGVASAAMLTPLTAPLGAVAAGVARSAGELVGGAAGPVAGGLARGGVRIAGGAGMGAGASLATGGDPKEGAIMGGLMAAPGGALDMMRDPRLPTGQIYSDLARGGGSVSPIRGAAGGMFDSDSYRALPEGEAGTNQMARERAGAMEQSVDARNTANKSMMDDAEMNASVRMGDKRMPTDEPRARIASMRQANRNSMGEIIDKDIERHLDEMDSHLQMKNDSGQPTSEATFRGAVNLKKNVNERADWGNPGTMDNRGPRRVAGALSDLTRGADPEYDAASQKYATEAGKLERVNDATVGRDVIDTGDRFATQRARVSTMEKAGTDRLRRPQLEEIAAENPEYAPYINEMFARNAAMKLRLGVHPGAVGAGIGGRTIGNVLGNAEAVGIRGIDATGRLSNLNYPAIPLEVAAYEGAKKRKKDAEKMKSRATFLDTEEGVER